MLALLRPWLCAAAVLCASCAATPQSGSSSDASSLANSSSESGGAATDLVAFTDPAPIDATSARLAVLGMSCPKCVSNVDLTLKRLTGVSTVAINMRDGIVDVGFSGEARPSPRDLARAVDDAGLTLARIEVVR